MDSLETQHSTKRINHKILVALESTCRLFELAQSISDPKIRSEIESTACLAREAIPTMSSEALKDFGLDDLSTRY